MLNSLFALNNLLYKWAEQNVYSIANGVPLFHVPMNSTKPELSHEDFAHLHPQFTSFWKPISSLDVNIWQRWLHTHRVHLLLNNDSPLPKVIYFSSHLGGNFLFDYSLCQNVRTTEGSYHTAMCFQAEICSYEKNCWPADIILISCQFRPKKYIFNGPNFAKSLLVLANLKLSFRMFNQFQLLFVFIKLNLNVFSAFLSLLFQHFLTPNSSGRYTSVQCRKVFIKTNFFYHIPFLLKENLLSIFLYIENLDFVQLFPKCIRPLFSCQNPWSVGAVSSYSTAPHSSLSLIIKMASRDHSPLSTLSGWPRSLRVSLSGALKWQ